MTEGIRTGFTVMVKMLLVAVTGTGQIALEVISTFILSPLASVSVVNIALVWPLTATLLMYH